MTTCRASDFAKATTAIGFASRYLLEPLGADARGLPSLAQANTSDNAWLTYQVAGDLLNVMERSRNNRTVWLVLDHLDQVVLEDQGQVRKLLDLLYSRAALNPWLRFVLLGVRSVPVPGLELLTVRDKAGPESKEALTRDVTDYLLRLFYANKVLIDENHVEYTAETTVNTCVLRCGGGHDHPDVLKAVTSEIIGFERRVNLRAAEGV